MLRALSIVIAFTTVSATAMAHPEPETTAPKSITELDRPQLPSKAEIQEAINQMPDMNAIMGEMVNLMKDEGFKDNMENSARAFSNRLERSGALENGENGMPDFNKAFAVMLETFSDEDAMGGMLDTMMGLAETMEKHVPETKNITPKEKASE
jgi:hypothetical protein